MDVSMSIPEEIRPVTGDKVKVTWDGFEIGSGFVSSDGHILIMRLDDSQVSREIQAKLTSGLTDHISINPRITKQKRDKQ